MPEQLIESINDTARMARTMLSLLLVAALVVVLILSFSTDENLFRDVSVELPQLGIGISIKQSYIFAPLIFLYLHLQVLYLLSVLARKMRALFEEPGPVAYPYQEHFDRLSAFAFIQLFRDQRLPSLSFLPWFLVWFGVVAIPLGLLFAMDLSFVRFQDDKITTVHHIIFITDLAFVVWFVWVVWPNYGEPSKSRMVSCVIQAIFGVTALLSALFAVTELLPALVTRVEFFPYQYNIEHLSVHSNLLAFSVIFGVIFGEIIIMRLNYISHVIQEITGGLMKISTTAAAIFMALFLIDSVNPPHFNPKNAKKDSKCIWSSDVQKDVWKPEEDDADKKAIEECTSDINYIDMWLCDFVDICRYLDLRGKWLASTQSIDLTGLISDELGDENAEDSRWSVNTLHVTDRSFRFAVFHSAKLYGANFSRAKLEGAVFTLAKLHSAEFTEAQLRNTKFRRSDSKDAVFHRSKSQSADFSFSSLQGASFSNAQLQGSDFEDAKLVGAFFRNARLQGANFEDARLQATDFTDAKSQGANFKNAKLNGAVLHKAKLQGANFSEAQLEGADLGGARLQGSFYKKELGSWKLAWMPDVLFTSCCGGQNEMIQEMVEDPEANSAVKLAWRENDDEDRIFIWEKMAKGGGQCVEREKNGDAQNTSLEDHLCDYLMPSTDRMKLDCKLIKEKGDSSEESTVICHKGTELYAPFDDEEWKKWREELAVRLSKLACKDGYIAKRVFSRLTKDEDVLSNDGPSGKWKEGRNILDCKRKEGKRACPGLNTIPDGEWSRLWTNFDDDPFESCCT